VSDYGLDDRAIGVRSRQGAKDFSSSLCVQTGSGAHPASCPLSTGVLSPGVKARPGREADHSPHLVPGSRMSRSYILSPQASPWRVAGLLYLLHWMGDRMTQNLFLRRISQHNAGPLSSTEMFSSHRILLIRSNLRTILSKDVAYK
jgi:hypothetical protein